MTFNREASNTTELRIHKQGEARASQKAGKVGSQKNIGKLGKIPLGRAMETHQERNESASTSMTFLKKKNSS